jgi:hypothetical protein
MLTTRSGKKYKVPKPQPKRGKLIRTTRSGKKYYAPYKPKMKNNVFSDKKVQKTTKEKGETLKIVQKTKTIFNRSLEMTNDFLKNPRFVTSWDFDEYNLSDFGPNWTIFDVKTWFGSKRLNKIVFCIMDTDKQAIESNLTSSRVKRNLTRHFYKSYHEKHLSYRMNKVENLSNPIHPVLVSFTYENNIWKYDVKEGRKYDDIQFEMKELNNRTKDKIFRGFWNMYIKGDCSCKVYIKNF